MTRIRQKRSPTGHRLQNAAFALNPKLDLEAAVPGYHFHERLRFMRVQLVNDEDPPCLRSAGDDRLDKAALDGFIWVNGIIVTCMVMNEASGRSRQDTIR